MASTAKIIMVELKNYDINETVTGSVLTISPSDVPELSSSDRAIDLIKIIYKFYHGMFIIVHYNLHSEVNFEIFCFRENIIVAVISNLEELDIKDAERFLRSKDF